MAAVSRGLMQAHERGIVHRDIKPANILLLEPRRESTGPSRNSSSAGSMPSQTTAAEPEDGARTAVLVPPLVANRKAAVSRPRIKISDFGLARHVVDTESLAVTAAGALMGTPHYMAPEQWTGRSVDSRTDVYAIGATLFHVARRPAAVHGRNQRRPRAQHCNEPPPLLEVSRPVSAKGWHGSSKRPWPSVLKIVSSMPGRCCATSKTCFMASRRTWPSIPVLPECDRATSSCSTSPGTWRHRLGSSGRSCPIPSGFNRAIGVQAPRFSARFDPEHGVRRFARMRRFVDFLWEEHPFEWVEPRRFGALREFQAGW